MSTIIALSDEEFQKLISKIEDLEVLLHKKVNPNTLGWVNNETLCKELGISKRTAQNYRDAGILPFSTLEGKVYYDLEQVKKILIRNQINLTK